MGPWGRPGRGQRSCDPRRQQLWRPHGGPEVGPGKWQQCFSDPSVNLRGLAACEESKGCGPSGTSVLRGGRSCPFPGSLSSTQTHGDIFSCNQGYLPARLCAGISGGTRLWGLLPPPCCKSLIWLVLIISSPIRLPCCL